jgi:hypothetical protein
MRQHKKIYRVRGKASSQLCARCGKRANHWAWIHNTDRENPFNYESLCRSCHFAYDDIIEKVAARQRGVPETPASIARRAKALQGVQRKDGKSGVPGVHRHGVNDTWRVQVHRTSGGCYPDFSDAVTARNELALRIYGPRAKQYTTDGSPMREADALSVCYPFTPRVSSQSLPNS